MIILVVSQSKRASTKTELHNCVQLYSNLWTLALCAFIATYWSVIVNKFLRDRSLMWVWVKKLCFINIFTRTFRTGDKICRLGSFFFQFSSRFVGSLLASDGGDRGSGRMLSPSVMLSCLLATFIGAFDCVTSVSPLVNMISMTQAQRHYDLSRKVHDFLQMLHKFQLKYTSWSCWSLRVSKDGYVTCEVQSQSQVEAF